MTEHWARDVLRRFGEFAEQFADCFGRCVQRTAASQYIEGLLNDSERKSMQAMHGRLTDPITYQALQHFITHSPWDANQLWLRLRALVSDRSGILALDGTGLPKQGKHSVGVKRQYCGALGKTGNCEVAVSTVLIGDRLVWPLSCELFLPKEWVDDETRRAEVGIPDGTRLREKWRIALAHVRLVRGAGFYVSAVVADELGFDHFEGRTLPGWQHHAVLTAAAFTFLQLERRRWPDASRPALPPVRLWMRDIAAILYVLGNRQLMKLLVSFERSPPLRR